MLIIKHIKTFVCGKMFARSNKRLLSGLKPINSENPTNNEDPYITPFSLSIMENQEYSHYI